MRSKQLELNVLAKDSGSGQDHWMELLTDIERSLVYDEIEVLRDREAWLYLRSNSMQAGRLLAMGTGLLRRAMWAE